MMIAGVVVTRQNCDELLANFGTPKLMRFWFLLAYHQVVYWLVGRPSEVHHENMASAWFELGRYKKCLSHCRASLETAETDRLHAMMAYCYGELANWRAAVGAYRSISSLWTTPAFAIGLAEAELRNGNIDEARKVISTIDVSMKLKDGNLMAYFERLKNEVSSSS